MKIKKRIPNPSQPRSGGSHKSHLRSFRRFALRFSSVTNGHLSSASGFTLVETVVATFLAAIMLPSIFACLAAGFSIVQTTRENLRVTQIIVQRMEAIRLASYATLQDPAAFPSSSTEYYSPSGQTNGNGGTVYKLTYTCAPGPSSLPPSYRTNMMCITVTAAWKSGKIQQTRTMQSYVARYGIQRYVSGS
jgi:type II secretory pathway pseudopilin PulG